ncbi:hypothetical protein INS49_006283 [Diaporthe citri]|uniref:uncharacterized protein n=1 Tax=Diaporthe citri TaxID=83186 RepID=UPI001C827B6C|nr:uncharacterized protein INS49_006283 [Diaporthe citri]KAG6364679.1 hypothetical protein INS49_006283 [Diaporthe citri]
MDPPLQDIYPSDDGAFITFPSRRSVVHSTNGIVSTSSPLATEAGLQVLRERGNAADAAIAAAAVLNLVDPSMTGIGGDAFCLFYHAKTRKVHALNGSGRSPSKASLDGVCRDLNVTDRSSASIPNTSIHSVTVPGAAAAWLDIIDKYGSGKVATSQVLAPGIRMAEEGVPVSEISSYNWQKSEKELRGKVVEEGLLKYDPSYPEKYRAPRAGEIIKNESLAKTFKLLAERGKSGFYEGPVAEAVVQVSQEYGGYLTLDDLRNHTSEEVDSPYLAQRARLFNPARSTDVADPGDPGGMHKISDTIYLCVTDAEGNACSLVNSVSDNFGSRIIPPGTGFVLQNRGSGFHLGPDHHPNLYAPGKRPYSTIIPAMVTNATDGTLHSVFGVMGGAMQPQGHVQVLMNMLRFGMNPQVALDAPRICIGVSLPGKSTDPSKTVDRTAYLEEGIGENVARELEDMGHEVKIVRGMERSLFGRGQIIRVHHDPADGQRVYSAGSDMRGDGNAAPLL